MRIVHRYPCHKKQDARAIGSLRQFNLDEKTTGDISIFDIEEDHPHWQQIREILHEEGLTPTSTETLFTREETTLAKWVCIMPDYVCGYPMPDNDFGYKSISFAKDKSCPQCGVGREQIAPIHLRGEPKLGKRQFSSLHWIFDYFAVPMVFDILTQEGITGFEPYPAINYKTGEELKTVRQFKIGTVLPRSVLADKLVRDPSVCGHIKYNVLKRGFLQFSKGAFESQPDLVLTNEWFGSGGQAFRITLASSRFVQVYIKNKWKGLSLLPVKIQ